jgi:Dyp-type peroxidase family
MTDRPLELDDIQGDILGGFNTDIQSLVGFTARDADGPAKAAQWLAGLSPEVTSVAQVRAQREAMKADPADPTLTWLGVAIGRNFLRSVAPDVWILDDAFNEGMADRATSALADRSDPKAWTAGATGKPIDVFLKVAANSEVAVRQRTDALVAAAAGNGLAMTYCEVGRRLNGEKEHFGFRDGISQPDIIGDQSTTGIGPGKFIFGYPRIPGGVPPTMAVDKRKLTDNGSLLVFRRLAQDVAEFHTFCAAEAVRLQPQWPGLTAPQLEALIIGRWPSGAPTHPEVTADPGTTNPDNSFDFHGDEGVICPFGAHIRKVNPRKGPADVVDVPRLLRRGIPFGPPEAVDPTGERGLLFLAYQASIATTFEFVTGHWMNSHNRPGTGDDVLIGRPFDPRDMPIQGPSGKVTVATGGKQWIHPTGGAYLFAPGRAALGRLATPAPAFAKFAASLLFTQASTGLRRFARRRGMLR